MDRNVFRLVIIFLGLTLIGGLAGVVLLGVLERNIPDVLQNVVVGALTGIAGLLARSPGAEEAQDVRVVNSAATPVPTEDVVE